MNSYTAETSFYSCTRISWPTWLSIALHKSLSFRVDRLAAGSSVLLLLFLCFHVGIVVPILNVSLLPCLQPLFCFLLLLFSAFARHPQLAIAPLHFHSPSRLRNSLSESYVVHVRVPFGVLAERRRHGLESYPGESEHQRARCRLYQHSTTVDMRVLHKPVVCI
jgi:hypothetical protein